MEIKIHRLKQMETKIQTARTTKAIYNIKNINIFCNNFEFGIVTSQGWGRMEKRDEPLIQMEIEGENFEFPLSEFIKKFSKERVMRKLKE